MRFTMDFLYDGWFDGIGKISFEGIDLGSTWNGWACPAFTKEVADEILSVINACSNEDGGMEFFDSEKGGYYTSFDGEYTERFDAMMIDGVAYYPIGAYCWTWEVVK